MTTPHPIVQPTQVPEVTHLHQPSNTTTQSASLPESSTPSVDARTAKFIDQLRGRFKLSVAQKDDLLALYQLGTSESFGVPLARADIMARMYILACQYGTEQRRLQSLLPAPTSESVTGGGELVRLIKELKIRLDDNFQVTKDQKTHIRLVCQELISKPTRTSYKNLHSEVEKKMRATPETYKLSNIFGQLTREQKWASELKRIASNTRNVFRQEIRDSIIGEKICSLEGFTTDRLARYRLGTSSTATEQGYLIRYVILRRFAYENKALLGEEPDSDDLTTNSSETSVGTKKRKRASPGRGRVAHGEDFWSRVDAWLQERIALWGNDFSGDHWKNYVEESIDLDNHGYKSKAPTPSASPMPLPALFLSVPQSHPASIDNMSYSSPLSWIDPRTSSHVQTAHQDQDHRAASTSMVNDFLQDFGYSQAM